LHHGLAWSLRQTCSDNLTGGEVKNAKGLSVVVFSVSMGEGGTCTIPRVMRAHEGVWFYLCLQEQRPPAPHTPVVSLHAPRTPAAHGTQLPSGRPYGGKGGSPPPPPLCGSRHPGGVPPRRLVGRCPVRIRPASSAAAVAPSCHHPLPGSATVLQKTKHGRRDAPLRPAASVWLMQGDGASICRMTCLVRCRR